MEVALDSKVTELRWHIGKETGRLDRPPYRAYFYWLQDGEPMDAAGFDERELGVEIARRKADREDFSAFEAARSELARANR